ncbi:alpha-1,4-glucan--maltose-1-phosphate maltosyltransferase [Burkholderia ubonensis]|uniref:alpha-1,4-glucan--maltose-1-phosphate maltosyltransferase n=1 Tax=Burkholderia ubonensis TaxID=101571 RepID=UPI0014533430|nr:alpha-1,4-glucan--maltose-1-phosphate maltosyltransferase [Burkholderia ubonensis]VWB86423.1 alpha-amylase-like protein [Burkholderia ubonensis]
MTRPPSTTSGAPRIYCLPLAFALDREAWLQCVGRAAEMGFSRILTTLAACGASLRQPVEPLAAYADAARANGLALDLVIERQAAPAAPSFAVDGAYAEHPLPDPRRALPLAASPPKAPAAPRDDDLAERLIALAGYGVAGFCLRGVDAMPIAQWSDCLRRVRDARPGTAFFAWTPGLPRARMIDAAARFDGVFLSSCWWDLRAAWLLDEHADLATSPCRIALADDPFGGRALDAAPPRHRMLACQRALAVAFELGDGILVPAGMEFAWSGPVWRAIRTPADLSAAWQAAAFNLAHAIARGNARLARRAADRADLDGGVELQRLAGPSAPIAVFARVPGNRQRREPLRIVAANISLSDTASLDAAGWSWHDCTHVQPLDDDDAPVGTPQPLDTLRLAPGEVRAWRATRPAPVAGRAARTHGGGHAADKAVRVAEDAVRAPRLFIDAITPAVDNGRFAVKCIAGEAVRVEADVVIDGHDVPSAVLLWRPVDSADWREVDMAPLGNDRWMAEFRPDRIGRYEFTIEAWRDPYVNWCREVGKKVDAGLDITLELREGALILADIARHAVTARARLALEHACRVDDSLDAGHTLSALTAPTLADAVAAARFRPYVLRHLPPQPVDVEPALAGFASWYELFPRSQSNDPSRHGTFDDVIARLPAIRAMGFDVLYFPPVHPIGTKHRKGRNNSKSAAPGDPGSPYAIGAEAGGHDALHPALGTFDDFRRLNEAAHAHGLALALDFAVQCSPDHPWLTSHSGWFDWRPDGSLRYAENPPKKYEDIVNVDFYTDDAMPGLWLALRDVVLFWIGHGVTLFRVDNPHTKPLPFWEWLIATVRADHPEVVFLSEAFTRPKMMYRLAKIGFSQSYTYFTWRHSKQEFIDYLSELTRPDIAAYFRPHFFVNTPDINPLFLQTSGRPGFLIRAALAALLSGLWGVYNGFELCESAALAGREEYLDSEKYQLRAWDWNRPGNIVQEIAQLNRIRRAHPALHTHRGLTFHNAFDPHILYFAKTTPRRDDVVLAAINLDPFAAHEADFEVPLWEWGLADDAVLAAENLLDGTRFAFHGKRQHVRLAPDAPYAIWAVRPLDGEATP